MEKNVISVYKYNGSENISFLYSISNNKNKLVRYSYFIITKDEDGKPQVTKLDNAIAFLQRNGLNITPIKQEDPEYEEFLTLFSLAIRFGRPIEEIHIGPSHKLKKAPMYSDNRKKN